MSQVSLTWADALKLAVPTVIPFVLLIVTYWFHRRQETRAKAESVRRAIEQASSNLVQALRALDVIKDDLKKGKVTIVHLDIPATTTAFAARLAELDTKNAYVYSQYVSFAEIARSGMKFLMDLMKAAATAEIIGPRLQSAVESQVKALKGDLIVLAEQELLVLKSLSRIIPFDAQIIAIAESSVNNAKKPIPA